MVQKITIIDTTLRDGEQTAGVSFKVDEKLTIAKSLLLDLNVDYIEIASARVSIGELEAVKQICIWAKENNLLDRVEVLGFVDNYKSIEWIKQSGCKKINLLCKGSLNHLKNQLKKTKEEHARDINETIKEANTNGLNVNIYLEDVSNGIKESIDYVFYLLDNLNDVDRIMLPDTLGIWSPTDTHKYCKILVEKYPNKNFDFHAHNDYGLAVANSLAALIAGVKGIHTTVNGLGERTGNCPLASTIAVINDHTKYTTNINEKKLSGVSKLVESISGIRLPPTAPIVGANVHTQCCGIHADGDKKGDLYCNPLTPERFGGERVYALGKTSGKASLSKNLEKLGIELDEKSKEKVLKRIIELGDKKESITTSDLPYIISDVLGESIQENIKLVDYSLVSKSKELPLAKVTLKINDKDYSSSAKGDGQYNAFMKAVSQIYKDLELKLPKLVDYAVQIPPGGKTDALVETVITWNNGHSYKTKGVDPDQTSAAIKATLNMLNQQ